MLRNNALVANQINPNQSFGTFFDSLWGLTDGQRAAQTQSTVQILCTGVAGTTIPFNSRVTDSQNVIWRASNNFVIPVGGSVSASFRAEEFGAIAAAPNTLTTILDGTLGWETANNPVSATLGLVTQSDQAAKLQRKNQLALQGNSTSLAISSNVSAVEGVKSLSFRENRTDATKVIDGVSLVARSIWVAVDGGTDEDIALAIVNSKSGGSDWNGAVAVPVTDPTSGQVSTVNFDRPVDVPVVTRITVRVANGSTPELDIIESVLRYANGELEGEEGFVLGGDVSPFEIAAAVNSDVTDMTSRVHEYNCSVDLLSAVLWQDNEATNLQGLLNLKQEWYNTNHCGFWNDWIVDVFDLNTANAFGLQVWSKILNLELYSNVVPSPPDFPAFGFSDFGLNFEHGSFATDSDEIFRLSTEEIRTVLKFRFFQLVTRATIPEINRFLFSTFNFRDIYVLDGFDMTMRYINLGRLSSELRRALIELDVLPRPAAVSLEFAETNLRSFGFSDSSENFDNGNFIGG